MKRILAILLILAMLLSLAACGGKEEPANDIPASKKNTEAPTEAPTEPPKDPNLGKVFNVGDYEFTYLESFIVADANGKPVVVVHFDYANHNTKKEYAFWHMRADSTMTQNGVELEYAKVKSPDGSINYDDTTYEKVGNGNHTEVYMAYYLVDGTSPVTMFYACMGEEGTAEFTLDLSFAEIIGEVEFPAEPEPTEAPTEPAGSVKPKKPSSFIESFTISDDNIATVTVHYPASFTYEADYRKGTFLHERPYVYGGILTGADYTVDFGFVQANNYYKTVENYVKTFKGTDIYEEIEVCGLKGYVRQDKTSRLNIVICLDETRMLMLEVAVPGDGDEDIYRPIWEGDVVPAIVENLEITLEKVVSETVFTDKGYVSMTEVDGWKKGDPKSVYNLTLYNSSLGTQVWVDVQDLQLGDLQQTMDIISSGFPNATWTETTIGAYTLKYLDCGTCCYLVGETSTGKPFEIEIWNCTLDQARTLLETMVIG